MAVVYWLDGFKPRHRDPMIGKLWPAPIGNGIYTGKIGHQLKEQRDGHEVFVEMMDYGSYKPGDRMIVQMLKDQNGKPYIMLKVDGSSLDAT